MNPSPSRSRGIVLAFLLVAGSCDLRAQDSPFRLASSPAFAPAPGGRLSSQRLGFQHEPSSGAMQRHLQAMRLQEAQAPPAQQQPQSTRPQYRHLSSTDHWQPNDFWYTDRDTIVGQTAVDAWDPLKIINTDRPDYADVATVVGDGVVQIESGFLRSVRRDDVSRTKVDSGPNMLVRYGIGERFELRVKWRGYVHEKLTDVMTDRASLNGLGDGEIGCKWVAVEQHDLLPMQTFVLRCGLPVGDSSLTAKRIEPGLSYIYNWQIRRWWFLRGATGVDLFHQPAPAFRAQGLGLETRSDQWLELSQAVSSYFQVAQRVGVFAEWFLLRRHGSQDDHPDHFHDYGAYLYATPDVQFDVRIGWRLGDHVDQTFWGAGVSMRF
jgi:hypothetical protein